jgi:hypothetical protein
MRILPVLCFWGLRCTAEASIRMAPFALPLAIFCWSRGTAYQNGNFFLEHFL